MKRLVVYTILAPLLLASMAQAQCIMDVQYLEDSPFPCHFVGTVNSGNFDCIDFTASPEWKYVWKISGADDGELIATYEGFAFDHVFEKFGGYDFVLEIHKDGNIFSIPDHFERVSYTTCEPCGQTEIVFNYLDCPFGVGCNLQFSTKIKAENTVGLKPTAKYIITYEPTPQEVLGGAESYELVFPDVEVEFHPDSGHIVVAEDLNVIFRRGCYRPRLEMELEYGAGAHSTFGGAPCTDVDVFSEKVFRCISCTNPKNDCEVNIAITKVSNEEGTCEPMSCWSRSAGFETEETPTVFTELSLSPNPVSERLHIELPDTGHDNLTMYLLDGMGKAVEIQALEGQNSTDIDVSGQVPGIYLLAIRAEGRIVLSERVVIAH